VNPNKWLAIVVAYTVLTLLCVYLIPSNSDFSAVRIVLAFIFVAFAPGYCLINFLFQERQLDSGEQLVLSVALSFAIAGISGLFLGLSPIGIGVTSITYTLSGIVIVLTVMSYLKKTRLLKFQLRELRAHNLNPIEVTT
jgi:uncharacterized membrane protein